MKASSPREDAIPRPTNDEKLAALALRKYMAALSNRHNRVCISLSTARLGSTAERWEILCAIEHRRLWRLRRQVARIISGLGGQHSGGTVARHIHGLVIERTGAADVTRYCESNRGPVEIWIVVIARLRTQNKTEQKTPRELESCINEKDRASKHTSDFRIAFF